MKILLLGEYSALHKNLKEGLQQLGHDVVIASTGDGWKKIEPDIDLLYHGRLKKIMRRIYPLSKIKYMSGFDVAQLINPFVFYGKFYPSRYFIEQIAKQNNRLFMLAAGDDAYFWKYSSKVLRYSAFDDFLKYDLKSPEYYMQKNKAFEFNDYVISRIVGIIPVMYEYEVAYQYHPKRRPTIPIPMNTEKIDYIPNVPQKKLVVSHGLNRYGTKGTRYVEAAFEILRHKYPNDLELIISEKMPLDQYLALMRRTNIVIDQTSSYSCGVNAIYALAMGKVVLGGAEPESLRSLGVSRSPVINILPSSESIVEKIKMLLERKGEIEHIGHESRAFCEKVHGHISVAKRFIEAWNKDW